MRGVATDVTDRRRTEESLRESELKFRTLAESTPAAIFIHNGSRFCYVNPAAAAMTGYSTLVEADAIQIEQVICNLLRNALEAMWRRNGQRELLVETAMPRPDEVEVAVRDTGQGFPPELAAQLFAPFFTTKPQGLGMGLSISRSIIEAHGGRIWARSTPGQGTTVRFNLPVRPRDCA